LCLGCCCFIAVFCCCLPIIALCFFVIYCVFPPLAILILAYIPSVRNSGTWKFLEREDLYARADPANTVTIIFLNSLRDMILVLDSFVKLEVLELLSLVLYCCFCCGFQVLFGQLEFLFMQFIVFVIMKINIMINIIEKMVDDKYYFLILFFCNRFRHLPYLKRKKN
jgi:hypothetical protein